MEWNQAPRQQQQAGGPPHWPGASYEVLELSIDDVGTVTFDGEVHVELSHVPDDDRAYFMKLVGTKFRVSFVPMRHDESLGKR